MAKPKYFKSKSGNIPLPVFFPDATRAVLKTLDSVDIENTKTLGILVNTYHLYKDLGKRVIKEHKGVRNFMNWRGGLISDSGGFQINTLGSKVTDILTPEKSIDFQIALGTDMVVVFDEFTPPSATYDEAKKTVENTIEWAKRSKDEFEKLTHSTRFARSGPRGKPYILGVAQGGKYQDLREYCTKELVKIGFDGIGYGGWPINDEGKFDYETAETLAKNVPDNYFLYGLGVGKPQEIVKLVEMGYNIFDCVLPTRDARHKRLYVYNAESIEEIDVHAPDFYSYYVPDKEKYYHDTRPVSTACDWYWEWGRHWVRDKLQRKLPVYLYYRSQLSRLYLFGE